MNVLDHGTPEIHWQFQQGKGHDEPDDLHGVTSKDVVVAEYGGILAVYHRYPSLIEIGLDRENYVTFLDDHSSECDRFNS